MEGRDSLFIFIIPELRKNILFEVSDNLYFFKGAMVKNDFFEGAICDFSKEQCFSKEQFVFFQRSILCFSKEQVCSLKKKSPNAFFVVGNFVFFKGAMVYVISNFLCFFKGAKVYGLLRFLHKKINNAQPHIPLPK